MAVRTDPRQAGAHVRARRPVFGLVAAGALIEGALVLGVLVPLRLDRHPPALSTNLAVSLGVDARGLARYLALIAALLVGYVLALRLARQLRRTGAVAFVAATALFGVTLLPAHPGYSSDVFHYVAIARVAFTYEANPHVTPPQAFPDDPLMSLSGWWWLPSPYGPAWTWLSRLPHAAAGGSTDPTRLLIAFKALTLLGVVGTCAALAAAAERLLAGSGALAAVAFGWNPLVLLHLAGDGHNDAVMLGLLALGLLALASGRRLLALAGFGVAGLVKIAALPAAGALALFLLLNRGLRAVIAAGVVLLLLAAVLTAPYWEGSATFKATFDEGRYFTNTPAALAVEVLTPLLGENAAITLLGVGMRLALLGVLVWLVRRAGAEPRRLILATATGYTLAVSLLCAWYQPWYASWALLCWAALPRSRASVPLLLALTTGALLVPASVNFLPAVLGWDLHSTGIELLTVLSVHLPLGAALVWLWGRRSAREDDPVN